MASAFNPNNNASAPVFMQFVFFSPPSASSASAAFSSASGSASSAHQHVPSMFSFLSGGFDAAPHQQSQQQQPPLNPFFFIPMMNLAAPLFANANANNFFAQAFDPQAAGSHKRPASQAARDRLPVSQLPSTSHACGSSCPVCQDVMNAGDVCASMPCGHFFHADCLVPWLQQQNTCPVCRFEIETDDAAYNATLPERNKGRKVVTPGSTNDSTSAQNGNSSSSSASAADLKLSLHSRECGLGHSGPCVLLEDFSVARLPCGHSFHTECLRSHNNVRMVSIDIYMCPSCRACCPRSLTTSTACSDPSTSTSSSSTSTSTSAAAADSVCGASSFPSSSHACSSAVDAAMPQTHAEADVNMSDAGAQSKAPCKLDES